MFGTVSGKNIAILGFSFKANTNDTRESPAIDISNDLLKEGAILSIYDSRVNYSQIENDLNKNDKLFNDQSKEGKWSYQKDIYKTAKNADAVVILTESDEFKVLDWSKISKNMRSPSWVFDTKGIINMKEASVQDINIWTVGQG